MAAGKFSSVRVKPRRGCNSTFATSELELPVNTCLASLNASTVSTKRVLANREALDLAWPSPSTWCGPSEERVKVESELNHGSTFYFTLPRQPVVGGCLMQSGSPSLCEARSHEFASSSWRIHPHFTIAVYLNGSTPYMALPSGCLAGNGEDVSVNGGRIKRAHELADHGITDTRSDLCPPAWSRPCRHVASRVLPQESWRKESRRASPLSWTVCGSARRNLTRLIVEIDQGVTSIITKVIRGTCARTPGLPEIHHRSGACG